VGWIETGRYNQKIKNLKFMSSVATASLPQLTLAEFLKNGGYAHHLRRIRRLFEQQVAIMSRAVAASFPQGIRMTRPRGGFVLWIEMPKNADAMKLHGEALRENISIAPGPMFSAQGGFKNFIRLNCGNPWSPEIERGVAVLGHLVKRMSAQKK
jgi:DNA-binding transcriptional MocR family regulator